MAKNTVKTSKSMEPKILVSRSTGVPSISSPRAYDREILDHVLQVHKKILESPALNGGFERVESQLEDVKSTHEKSAKLLSEVHEAIYHPEKGVYAKINEINVKSLTEAHAQDKNIDELIKWKKDAEVSLKESAEKKAIDDKKIEDQQKIIEGLERWKGSVSGFLKWTGGVLGGAAVALISKLTYDYITNHWKLAVV